jgi:pyridoxal 5'-phosphate synthase pdxS subunit
MSESNQHNISTPLVKRGLAEMLKGGVIMDVVTADQAKIAEDAGAVAVMALERVPADIRAQGGVARMSDPDLIDQIIASVSIPVMAKARIGHFVEAQILESLKVDYIDESEVLSPADYVNHIDKWKFEVPFVCGATNLGEALRRITEGAAMIRSKGEAGTGDVSEATKHIRTILGEVRALSAKTDDELYVAAKELQAPYQLVREVATALENSASSGFTRRALRKLLALNRHIDSAMLSTWSGSKPRARALSRIAPLPRYVDCIESKVTRLEP